jgi:molecular chaperone GrpE
VTEQTPNPAQAAANEEAETPRAGDAAPATDRPAATGGASAAASAPGPASGGAATVSELEDRLRRALADLDNLRKRYERELARERAAERARLAALWLPIVDDLDRALEHADGDPAALIEGIRAVRDQAVTTLAQLGFPRFTDVGRPFDGRGARRRSGGHRGSGRPAGVRQRRVAAAPGRSGGRRRLEQWLIVATSTRHLA